MQYRSGTVSVTNGLPTITFAGNTADASGVAIGDYFKADIDGAPIYQLTSRTPTSGATLTSATLSPNYAGPTQAGLGYQIVKDFSASRGYPLFGQGDGDAADWLSKLVNMLDADLAILLGAGSTPRLPVPVTITGAHTVAATTSVLICNGSGSITLTLPAAASFPGRVLWIRNITAFAAVSASANVVPRVGGAAGTAILPATDGAWTMLVSDGTNWQIQASS